MKESWNPKKLLRVAAVGLSLGASAPAPTSASMSQSNKETITHAVAHIEQGLVVLATKDPDAFLKRIKELKSPVPHGAVESLVKFHPEFALEHLDTLKHVNRKLPETLSRSMIIAESLSNMNVLSASAWIMHHPDLVAYAKRDYQELVRSNTDSDRFTEFSNALNLLEKYPSPDVAQLMTAFYLKHEGLAIEWSSAVQRADEFNAAQTLLVGHSPLLAEAIRVRGLDHIDKRTLSSTAREETNAQANFVRSKTIEEFKSIERAEQGTILHAASEWGKRFGVHNPFALAKYAVLVTRDLNIRGVSHEDEREIVSSIQRITAQQSIISNTDILKDRDLFTLISGDNDVNKDTKGERAAQLHDQDAMRRLNDIWKKENISKNETIASTLAVPFDAHGNVKKEDIASVKEEFLSYLGSQGRARTVFVEAHGAETAFSLYEDPRRGVEKTGDRLVFAKDFADAYSERLSHKSVQDQYKRGERDVYVFIQCLSYDFAQNIFKILKERHVPLPIIIVSGEATTSAVFLSPRYHTGGEDYFTEELINPMNTGQLNDVLERVHTLVPGTVGSPIIIFSPDENGRPIQITSLGNTNDTSEA